MMAGRHLLRLFESFDLLTHLLDCFGGHNVIDISCKTPKSEVCTEGSVGFNRG